MLFVHSTNKIHCSNLDSIENIYYTCVRLGEESLQMHGGVKSQNLAKTLKKGPSWVGNSIWIDSFESGNTLSLVRNIATSVNECSYTIIDEL